MLNKKIDIKELANFVSKEHLPKINLLYNKDIPKEPKTPDDLLLVRFAKLSESDIQKYFYQQIKILAIEASSKNKLHYLEAVKNDNGDAIVTKLSDTQKKFFYMRKKAEGFKSGFPDLTILSYSASAKLRDTTYLEVKKINAPSAIGLTEEQLNWFIKLNNAGFDSYITNNPVFFKNIILKQIAENKLFL